MTYMTYTYDTARYNFLDRTSFTFQCVVDSMRVNLCPNNFLTAHRKCIKNCGFITLNSGYKKYL